MQLEQLDAPTSPPATRLPAAGTGAVQVKWIGRQSRATRIEAASPLKLLAPRGAARNAACVVASTYGGGLVAGDRIDLQVDVGPGSRCLLATQASTKIYRSDDLRAGCTQRLTAAVAPDSVLVSLPDPLVPFAGSRYHGLQRFDVSAGASLVALDWFSAGRSACGERWALDHFETRMEIQLDHRCIFRDAIQLDPDDGPLTGPMRMGAIDCFATIVLAGPTVESFGRSLHDQLAAEPPGPRDGVLSAASALSPHGSGFVIRAAARAGVEPLARWLRQHLAFAADLVAGDFWLRKW